MLHNEIKILLNPYLDGELSKDQIDSVKEHLKICTECRTELDKIKKIDKSIQRIFNEIEIPSESYFKGLRSAIIAQLPEKPESSWKKYFYFLQRKEISAVAVMAFVLIFVIALRYMSDNFFNEMHSPLEKSESTAIYSRYLPPDEIDRTILVSSGSDRFEILDGEITQEVSLDEESEKLTEETVFEQPVLTFSTTEERDFVPEQSAGGIYGGMVSSEELSEVTSSSETPRGASGGSVEETTNEEQYHQLVEDQLGLVTTEIPVSIEEELCRSTSGDISGEYFSEDSEEEDGKSLQIDSVVNYQINTIFSNYLNADDNLEAVLYQIVLDKKGYISDMRTSEENRLRFRDNDVIIMNTLGKRITIDDSSYLKDTVIEIELYLEESP